MSMFTNARRARRAAVAGTAVAASLLIAACGSGSGDSAATSATTTTQGPRPVVTVDQAKQILDHYNAVNNAANAAFDSRKLATIEADGVLELDVEDYRQAPTFSAQDRAGYQDKQWYVDPRFAIPAGRDWFMAHTELRGAAFEEGERGLFVFQRKDGAWKMVFSSITDRPLPPIATDDDGLPTVVGPRDRVGTLAPGDLHEAVVDMYVTGGRNAGRQLDGSGPFVQEMLEDHASKPDSACADSLHRPLPVGHPQVYALRTADGGTLAAFNSRDQLVELVTSPGCQLIPTGTVRTYVRDKAAAIVHEFLNQNLGYARPGGKVDLLGVHVQLVGAESAAAPE
jgi:hypothetical protein